MRDGAPQHGHTSRRVRSGRRNCPLKRDRPRHHRCLVFGEQWRMPTYGRRRVDRARRSLLNIGPPLVPSEAEFDDRTLSQPLFGWAAGLGRALFGPLLLSSISSFLGRFHRHRGYSHDSDGRSLSCAPNLGGLPFAVDEPYENPISGVWANPPRSRPKCLP